MELLNDMVLQVEFQKGESSVTMLDKGVGHNILGMAFLTELLSSALIGDNCHEHT